MPRKGNGPTRETRLSVLNRDEWRCKYCGIRLADYPGVHFKGNHTQQGGQPADFATVDHIIPKARGGTNHIKNLIAACYPCNHRRGSLSYDLFRKHLRMERAAGRQLPIPDPRRELE